MMTDKHTCIGNFVKGYLFLTMLQGGILLLFSQYFHSSSISLCPACTFHHGTCQGDCCLSHKQLCFTKDLKLRLIL